MSGEVATHTVTYQRYGDDAVYTLGTYYQKFAEKMAQQLASRIDVCRISVRATWEK